MSLVRSAFVVVVILLMASPANACVPLPPPGVKVDWAHENTHTAIILKWSPSLMASEAGVESYNVHHFIYGEAEEPPTEVDEPDSDGNFSLTVNGVGTGTHILFVTAVAGSLESPPGAVIVVLEGRLFCTPVVPTTDRPGLVLNQDCLDHP